MHNVTIKTLFWKIGTLVRFDKSAFVRDGSLGVGDGQAVTAGEQLNGAGAEGREIGEHAREARRGGSAVGPRGRGGPRERGGGDSRPARG